jgi:lipoprotein-releasing system permease protein
MDWLPFEIGLALRYLRPKRTAVSFITLISVVGVMLGVAVLIIVNSVFSGFHLQLKQTFFQFAADIQVRQVEIFEEDGLQKWRAGAIENYDELADQLGQLKGVKGTMPVVGGKVMLETVPESGAPVFDAPVLFGVDAERMKQVSQVPSRMVEGEFDLRGNGLVVGYNFGRDDGLFRLDVGDRVLIYSPQSLKEMKDAQEEGETLGILPEEYTVRGVFDAGQNDLNDFMFCSIYNAQDLYHLEDVAHVIWVETDDPLNLKPLIREIDGTLGEGYLIGTWKDLNPVLLQQVEVEKNVTGFLMFFIVIVAAFGIASSLIIFGVQKTKEIGLLKALGATNGQVSLVFLIQSAVVGVLGTSLGVGLGMLVLKYRNDILDIFKERDMELFPEELYGFPELPAQIVMGDLVVISLVSLALCVVAGLLPAWNAARLQPVEALRND